MRGKEKTYKSFCKGLYIKVFDWIQKTFLTESVGIYDKTKMVTPPFSIGNGGV